MSIAQSTLGLEDEGLAQVLSDLARSLAKESSVDETLDAMTESSVLTVPGADYAGISLVEGRRDIHSVAPTAKLVELADLAQEELNEGPCIDAIWQQRTVSVENMEAEHRWPRFAPRAVGLGVRSMLSFQLFTDGRNLGALNLYSCRPHAFHSDSVYVGGLFASHAAVALRGAQMQKQLNQAVESRDVIGQAKGILMERHTISSDQAFALLVRTSQTTHRKLIEVAELLVRSVEAQAVAAG
ncbi:MAG TPA: GAF and ANTAR domain-containing protein [Frankiaceae bacterium]|nr:GAF and ANTAR domain-containing protein [Frankiaceae bacterium]